MRHAASGYFHDLSDAGGRCTPAGRWLRRWASPRFPASSRGEPVKIAVIETVPAGLKPKSARQLYVARRVWQILPSLDGDFKMTVSCGLARPMQLVRCRSQSRAIAPARHESRWPTVHSLPKEFSNWLLHAHPRVRYFFTFTTWDWTCR